MLLSTFRHFVFVIIGWWCSYFVTASNMLKTLLSLSPAMFLCKQGPWVQVLPTKLLCLDFLFKKDTKFT